MASPVDLPATANNTNDSTMAHRARRRPATPKPLAFRPSLHLLRYASPLGRHAQNPPSGEPKIASVGASLSVPSPEQKASPPNLHHQPRVFSFNKSLPGASSSNSNKKKLEQQTFDAASLAIASPTPKLTSLLTFYNQSQHRDEAWEFGPGYSDWLANRISDELAFTPYDRFADIGCGTGRFSKLILQTHRFCQPISCIEPAENLLRMCLLDSKGHVDADLQRRINLVCADALSISNIPSLRFTKCLLKEMIHHIPSSDDRVRLFSSLRRIIDASRSAMVGNAPSTNSQSTAIPVTSAVAEPTISEKGCLLIVTRGQESPFPLWQDARAVWRENALSTRQLMDELNNAGFPAGSISLTRYRFFVRVHVARYRNMLRDRFLSTLSRANFDDSALARGIEELLQGLNDSELLCFEDELLFVKACC